MIDRVLEPEVMDSPEDAADYDAMDHAQVNRVFVADFLAALTDRAGAAPNTADVDGRAKTDITAVGEVLDVGTGTAQIPMALCREASALRMLAIDLAASMLELAERNLIRAGLVQQVRLERVDAKRMPYAAGRFAAVISNSIIHHIPEPASVLAEMCRVTAPGGLLFVRDLARPANMALLDHLVDTYAAGANPHQRQLFADSLRAALSLPEMQTLVGSLGFDAASVALTSDRHWTWCATKPPGH